MSEEEEEEEEEEGAVGLVSTLVEFDDGSNEGSDFGGRASNSSKRLSYSGAVTSFRITLMV